MSCPNNQIGTDTTFPRCWAIQIGDLLCVWKIHPDLRSLSWLECTPWNWPFSRKIPTTPTQEESDECGNVGLFVSGNFQFDWHLEQMLSSDQDSSWLWPLRCGGLVRENLTNMEWTFRFPKNPQGPLNCSFTLYDSQGCGWGSSKWRHWIKGSGFLKVDELLP